MASYLEDETPQVWDDGYARSTNINDSVFFHPQNYDNPPDEILLPGDIEQVCSKILNKDENIMLGQLEGKALPFIPLRTAVYEQELLHPPHRGCVSLSGKVYDEPECKKGSECCAMDLPGSPGSIPLRASFDESTEKHFKETGTLPDPSIYPPQLCVVCHRMRISEIVTRVSMGLYTLSHDQDFYIQKYRNECTDNEPETYRADKCFVPGGAGDSVYNGIIDPIVCYTTPDDYEWKCKDGKWYVDQSNLMNAALL
jgi:hypothetical protein